MVDELWGGAESREVKSPDEAIELLLAGNRGFQQHHSQKFFRATAGLHEEITAPFEDVQPFAAVVECMDSRISPELIFEQGLGKLFVIRSAGPMVSAQNEGQSRDDVIGSLEFTVARGVKLIVVLTHTKCGALQGVIDLFFSDDDLMERLQGKPHLRSLLKRGLDSVAKAKRSIDDPARKWTDGTPSAENEAFVIEVARFHRDAICEEILKSPFLKSECDAERIKLMKGIYNVETGEIFEFSKAHS
jgi:carbonic anhydrase